MPKLFVAVSWPESQELMDLPNFYDHAYLINDVRGMANFGSSAYFVEKSWLDENTSDL